uniref:LRRK2 ARM repeat domain-containing protein n=1 Tax=Amphora coffeiformis TaxID=265554 RepID=A0A7S3L8X0_9STRA|eukprot:scaffold162_cov176-Amphora_coffeaeformis.AAC.55
MYLSKEAGDDERNGDRNGGYRKRNSNPSSHRSGMNSSNKVGTSSKHSASSSTSSGHNKPPKATQKLSSFLDELEQLNAEIKAEEEKPISQSSARRGSRRRDYPERRKTGNLGQRSDTSPRGEAQKSNYYDKPRNPSRERVQNLAFPNNPREAARTGIIPDETTSSRRRVPHQSRSTSPTSTGSRRRTHQQSRSASPTSTGSTRRNYQQSRSASPTSSTGSRRSTHQQSRSNSKTNETRGRDKEPILGDFGEYLEQKMSANTSRSSSRPTETRRRAEGKSSFLLKDLEESISVKSSKSETSQGINKKPAFWEELEQMVPAKTSSRPTKTPLGNVKSSLFMEYLEQRVSVETSKSSKPRVSQGRRPSFLAYAEQKTLANTSRSSRPRYRPQRQIQRPTFRENKGPKRSVETQKRISHSKQLPFGKNEQRPSENIKSDKNPSTRAGNLTPKVLTPSKNGGATFPRELVDMPSRTKSSVVAQKQATAQAQPFSWNKIATSATQSSETQSTTPSAKAKIFQTENISTGASSIKAQSVCSATNTKDEKDLSEQNFSEEDLGLVGCGDVVLEKVEENFKAIKDFSEVGTGLGGDVTEAERMEEDKMEESEDVVESEDEVESEEDVEIEEEENYFDIIEEEEDEEEDEEVMEEESSEASYEDMPIQDELTPARNNPLQTVSTDVLSSATSSDNTRHKLGSKSIEGCPSIYHSPRQSKRDLARIDFGPESCDGLSAAALVAPVPAAPVSRKSKSDIKEIDPRFKKEKDDMVREFNEILKLVQGNENRQIKFGVGEGITRFVGLLKKYQEYLEILEPGFQIIAELANIDTNRDTLAEQGCIEFVLVAMLQHEWGLVLQERGCNALASFAKTQKHHEWLLESNGIELLVAIQTAYATEIKIQVACLRAIHNLARNDDKKNSFTIAAKGGLNSLMEIVKMPEHCRDLEFQMEAMAYMATLSRTNDWNRGAIAARGGLKTTLKALKMLPNEDLHAVGYDTLYCLSVGHAHNTDEIVADGVTAMLVRSMKMNATCRPLQESGVRLAKLLTERGEITKKFVDAGGIEVIMVAMRTFEDSQIIQDVGCSVMLNMSMQPENKDTMCALGCVGLIIRAMKHLWEDADIQKIGCKALESLASSDDNKKAVAVGGGISAIMSAMETHVGVPALQGLAVGALRKLATIARNRDTMNEGNCIETVEQAMTKYPTNIFLHDNGKPLLILLDPSRDEDDY